jgi:Spy/CpxP family protein refolding chaperone
MKNLLSLLFIVFFSTSFCYAQPGQGQGQRPRMSPEQREEMMATRLGLNDDQKALLKEINEKYTDESNTLREHMRSAESQNQRGEVFTKMRELRTKQNNEIREILNEEQKVKFDEMLKEMEERMKQRRENRKNNPRGGAVRPGK